jgi:hypothetical protein
MIRLFAATCLVGTIAHDFVSFTRHSYLNCDTDLECRDWVDALRPFVSTCGYGTLTPDVNRVSRLIGVHLSIMEAKKYVSNPDFA